MKQMKIALMALVAVFMGTTFTSCLDSDSDNTLQAFVTINSGGGLYVSSLKTEDGLTFIPQNPQQMVKSDGSIPERAFISYELFEGESFKEGVTEYKIVFKSYDMEFQELSASYEPKESVTPLLGIYDYPLWAANGYLNVCFAHYYDKDVSTSDFSLFIDRVENNIVYFKIACTTNIEKGNTYTNQAISYYLPTESTVKEQYPNLTADKDGYYSAYVVCEGLDQAGEETELKTTSTIKVQFPKY
ncbi:hypothetical protein [Bacteroides sp. 51]|uniref:hypothetical protein n=1 Tax=Bacteroides sp. 51 TaxID=2302938 RepID=UPI0013D2ED23|nr:hypothetical protein [Bacteroides sp. 51]NDV83519.1 hypothetical protein [Bacteroides sp. 51]